MAALVPDKNLDHFLPEKSFLIARDNLAYYLGPVSPPGGDGSQFQGYRRGVPHSTVGSALASHPAAPGLMLGVTE